MPGPFLQKKETSSKQIIAIAFLTVLTVLSISSCSLFDPLSKYDSEIETDITPIKEVFKKDFPVGAAVEPEQLEGPEGALLRYHFSSLTCENAMKFKSIHPKKNVYKFERADKIVKFAKKYNMKMRGHTFVWHHPDEIAFWIFLNKDGSKKNREGVLTELEEHMRTLSDRYKDDVYAWDVVNEAIDVLEDDNMRRTRWYRSIGPDYVHEAFKLARKVNPEALLFYNDYDTFKPRKRDAIIALIKDMQAKNVPIDGLGMQLHISNGSPSFESIEESIKMYRELGIQIHITELDISMYAHEYENFDNGVPFESHVVHQAHLYRRLFKLFRENQDVVTSVTLWGFNDGHTWLTGPPYNKPNWPFPFDEKFQSKMAYKGIIQADDLPKDEEVFKILEPMTYKAPKGTPSIDANIDAAWKKAPVIKTENVIVGDKVSTASIRVLWDPTHIYILAEVADDDLDDLAPQDYMDDSLEIFIDENNAKTKDYEKDDFQLRVSYKNTVSVGGFATTDMVKSATKVVKDGYLVELQFKLQSKSAKAGDIMGLDFQVNQTDGSGERTAITKWNDTTNESWKSTAGWGQVEFLK